MSSLRSTNREIVKLFDEFEIATPRDYYLLPPGDQPYFVKRLYRALTRTRESALKEARAESGVKFHFRTSGDLTSATPNLPTEVFLKKLSFYAQRTFVSFPFKELTSAEEARLLRSTPGHAMPAKRQRERLFVFGEIEGWRTPRGGALSAVGKVYRIDAAAFRDFLTVVTRLRPAMEAGVSTVIPLFPDDKRSLMTARRLGLTVANFEREELRTQFWEQDLNDSEMRRSEAGLSKVLLPHFDDVPFERLLEIRQREADLYDDFQTRFARVLDEAQATDSEARILEFLRDIDDGVRTLERRFAEIRTSYRRKNILLGLKFVSAGLVMMAPTDPEIRKSVLGLMGSLSAFDFVTGRVDATTQRDALRTDRFYLPWQVFRER
ncbi:MAG: hypothetical protein ABW167_09120 [Baekduia sp.]